MIARFVKIIALSILVMSGLAGAIVSRRVVYERSRLLG